jgi:hypothetical protein
MRMSFSIDKQCHEVAQPRLLHPVYVITKAVGNDIEDYYRRLQATASCSDKKNV